MNDDDHELARDRRFVASRWLAVGIEDLRVARLCLDAREPSPAASAYHCQQAAEKLVKGLLVLADVPFTKTHGLERLGTLAAPLYPGHAELFGATYLFTAWAFEFRYPGSGADTPSEPTEIGLRQAMAGSIAWWPVCARISRPRWSRDNIAADASAVFYGSPSELQPARLSLGRD